MSASSRTATAVRLEKIQGKYEILAKLHEGGMGAIYQVRHRLLREVRVVKVLKSQLARDPTYRKRFQREARAAIQLKHPNIVQIYDFAIDDDGHGFIVMEHLQGLTLKALLEGMGPPELDLTLEIARQGLRALGFLHARGYVHRDVSPDNLMLVEGLEGEPELKLIDLGVAKERGDDEGLTAGGMFLGKLRYASPEHFSQGGVASATAASDLYSFGLVLYELLTGRPAIAGADLASLSTGHLLRPPLAFSDSDPEGRVPGDLRGVVLRLLAKRPEDRYPSAAEVLVALERISARHPLVERDLGQLLEEVEATRTLVSERFPSGSTQGRLDAQFGLESTTARTVVMDDARRPELEDPDRTQQLPPPLTPSDAAPSAADPPPPLPPLPAPAHSQRASATRFPVPGVPVVLIAVGLLAVALLVSVLIGRSGSRTEPPAAAATIGAEPPSLVAAIRPQLHAAEHCLESGDAELAWLALGEVDPATLDAHELELWEDLESEVVAQWERLAAASEPPLAGRSEALAAALVTALEERQVKALVDAVRAIDAQREEHPEAFDALETLDEALARARPVKRVYHQLWTARNRRDRAGILRHAATLLAWSPTYAAALRLREAAAAELEGEAQELVAARRYGDAAERLEPLRASWPERPGLAERLAAIAERQTDDERLEAVLAAVDAMAGEGRWLEALERLRAVEVGDRFSERFAAVEAALEAGWRRQDAAAPHVVAGESTFRRGRPALLRLEITDDLEVIAVRAFVRTRRASAFAEVALLREEGDTWLLRIPVEVHNNRSLEVYVEATDRSGHVGRLGSAEAPVELKRRGIL